MTQLQDGWTLVKAMLSVEDSHQKTVYCMIPLIQMSRIGKSIGYWESRLVLWGIAGERGETGMWYTKTWGFVLGLYENAPKLMMMVVHNSELKTTAIYTLVNHRVHDSVSTKLVNSLVWEEGRETRKDRGR